MWHISVISPYNATNGTSTFSFNILHVYTATNGVCCVIIISNVINITTTNEIHSTCSISLNFVLLWIHHLLLFTRVTNNNDTIHFDYARHIPQSISRCSINNILCIVINYDHMILQVNTCAIIFVGVLQLALHPCLLCHCTHA